MTHGARVVVGENSEGNVVEPSAHRRQVPPATDKDGSVEPVITVDRGQITIDLRGHVDETSDSGVRADAGLLAADSRQLRLKRAIDVIGAIALFIALLPLLVVVAILIKLTSPGPILHVSDRVGEGAQTFRFYKFRSMFEGSDALISQLADQNEAAGPVFKIRQDPRVTSIGRWIRKLSIDELPQLLNVIKGDMSLVGPRPPTVAEVAEYSPYHLQRLLVKPGLTCIWQTQGRSDVDFEEWVKMDLEYIENWSFGMDLRLLVATVPAVLSGRGAY